MPGANSGLDAFLVLHESISAIRHKPKGMNLRNSRSGLVLSSPMTTDEARDILARLPFCVAVLESRAGRDRGVSKTSFAHYRSLKLLRYGKEFLNAFVADAICG